LHWPCPWHHRRWHRWEARRDRASRLHHADP
jgi:hypothetical protein